MKPTMMDRLPPRNIKSLSCCVMTGVFTSTQQGYTQTNKALTVIHQWTFGSSLLMQFSLSQIPRLVIYSFSVSLTGNTDSCKRIRGYWKFNN